MTRARKTSATPASAAAVASPASPAATSAAAAVAAATAAAPAEPHVNAYLAAFVMGIANRLGNGASNHYRRHFNLGMSEWRAMMAIGAADGAIGREVAEMADLDHAAASKSVRLLQERGLVSIEQTGRRGRAAIVRLTPAGQAIHGQLSVVAQRRQERLLAAFSPEEVELLWSLLRKLRAQVPHMNADGPDTGSMNEDSPDENAPDANLQAPD